jgi:hypothetical protein
MVMEMKFYKQEDVDKRIQSLLDSGVLVYNAKEVYNTRDWYDGILPKMLIPEYTPEDVTIRAGTGMVFIVPVKRDHTYGTFQTSMTYTTGAAYSFGASYPRYITASMSTVYQSKDDKVIVWFKNMFNKLKDKL